MVAEPGVRVVQRTAGVAGSASAALGERPPKLVWSADRRPLPMSTIANILRAPGGAWTASGIEILGSDGRRRRQIQTTSELAMDVRSPATSLSAQAR